MFSMDRSKNQPDEIPSPDRLPPDVVVSPDTRREKRLPPGQSRTKKWPVLDASGPPVIDLYQWRFHMGGLVERSVVWDWNEFQLLPRVKLFADFHFQ